MRAVLAAHCACARCRYLHGYRSILCVRLKMKLSSFFIGFHLNLETLNLDFGAFEVLYKTNVSRRAVRWQGSSHDKRSQRIVQRSEAELNSASRSFIECELPVIARFSVKHLFCTTPRMFTNLTAKCLNFT